ncbi:MAG: DUF2330 domain-containing protein [Deltaproteobacteria bacterium]|nr:DUF2330 domain-containing protein [Deltaproteobacteria bacterium]
MGGVGHSAAGQDSAVRGRARRIACLAGVTLGLAIATDARDADACGACYSTNNESTVVNDHRMAFSIGKQQTVLWDSISYSGNPREFAYVLPVKPGGRIEPSNEAFFAALDASTRPLIMPPQPTYSGYYDDEGGSGCGCGAMSSSDALSASSRGGDSSNAPPPVTVVDKATVGPYETVTVRSTNPEALETWLRDNGFAIPQVSGPIIASYVAEKFDFIAMRLQPGKDARAMTPIRIVSPGTDLTLPLRLMQIGAGSKVGITLYVIGEGRYRTTGTFPEVPVDFTKLIWDNGQNRSNYQELSFQAMALENGRGVITEYSDRPNLERLATGLGGNPPLLATYATACTTYDEKRPKPEPTEDAGADASDAAVDPDASGSDAGADPDAGDLDAAAPPDAGDEDAGTPRDVKAYCDDLDVAFEGMQPGQIWVTRLRANLPNAALADTLRLEAHPKQERVDYVHQTVNTGTIPAAQIARMRASRTHGTYALIAISAFVVTRLLRRKKQGSSKREAGDE